MGFAFGNIGTMGKSYSSDVYVWPVRTRQAGTHGSTIIQLPTTDQMTCYDTAGTVIPCAGTGQDGDIQAGVTWPNLRFNDNADGTVTDNLSGFIWTKNGYTHGPTICSPATGKRWEEALAYINCLNANSYLGYTDWRLPNFNEISSMIHYGQPNTATWLNSQGFNNVLNGGSYWSSTTRSFDSSMAWIVFINGGVAEGSKTPSSSAGTV